MDEKLRKLEEAVERAREDCQMAYEIGLDCCEESSEKDLKCAKERLDYYRNNGGRKKASELER